MRRRLLGAGPLAALLLLTPAAASAATFTANRPQDYDDDDLTDGVCWVARANGCTLRAAVRQANATAGADVIELPLANYTLALPGSDDTAALGDLDVTDPVIIVGTGPAVTIDGALLDRVFELHASATGSQLRNLIITRGALTAASGAPFEGGGVRSVADDVSLDAVQLLANSVTTAGVDDVLGGGLYSAGRHLRLVSVTASDNVIASNGAVAAGGGVYSSGVALQVSFVTLEANHVASANSAGGGGLASAGARAAISGLKVVDNWAIGDVWAGGGGWLDNGCETVADDVFASGNDAASNGSVRGGGLDLDALACGASPPSHYTRLNVQHNLAYSVGSSAHGGGLYIGGASGTIRGASLVSNLALAANGGAYGGGGEMWNTAVADLFHVDGNTVVSLGGLAGGAGLYLSDVNLSHAQVTANVGSATSQVDGGGIRSAGVTSLVDVRVEGNSIPNGTAHGAGVWNFGTMIAQRVIIRGNTASDHYVDGVGLYSTDYFTGDEVTVDGNSATGTGRVRGAGVYTSDYAFFAKSSISGNTATSGSTRGGGVYADLGAALYLSDSTVSSNQITGDDGGTAGGGIYLHNDLDDGDCWELAAGGIVCADGTFEYSTLKLASSTIARNRAIDTSGAATGGGLHVAGPRAAPSGDRFVEMINTILATNTSVVGPNSDGYVESMGYNLVDDLTDFWFVTTTGDVTGLNPQLRPLDLYGGSTRVHAIPSTSPAYNAGHPAGCVAIPSLPMLLTIDQRGAPREASWLPMAPGRCDIGAFELQPIELPPPPPAQPPVPPAPAAAPRPLAWPPVIPAGIRIRPLPLPPRVGGQ